MTINLTDKPVPTERGETCDLSPPLPVGSRWGILPGVLRRKDRYAKAFDYSSCHTGYTGEVVVEQSDGSKACVREPGGDQCYWVEKNNLAKIR